MSNDFQKSVKSTYLKYILTALSIVSGFLLSIVLAKYLSPDDFGLYSFVNKFASLIAVFTSFGLNSILLRYIPKFRVDKVFTAINTLIKYTLLIRFFSLTLLFLLVYLFLDSFLIFFNLPNNFGEYIIIVLAFVFLTGFIPLLSSVLSAYIEDYKNDYLNIYKAIATILIFWLILYNGGNVYEIVIAMFIIIMPIFIFLLLRVAKKAVYNSNNNNEIAENINYFNKNKQRVIKYGLYNFLTSTTGFLQDISVDVMVISHYLGNKEAGIYTIGATLALVLGKINPAEILKTIFYPLSFKKYAQSNDINEIKSLANFITKLSFISVSPFLLILILFSEQTITYVYNTEYQNASSIIVVLGSFYFFRLFLKRYQIFFLVLEQNKINFWGSFFGILNFILSVILIQYYGIIGVAFSTGIVWFFTLVYFAVMLRYYLGIKLTFPTISIFKICLLLCLTTLFLLGLENFVTDLYSLIAISAITLVFYFGIFLLIRYFSKEEAELINKAIGINILNSLDAN